MFLLLIYFFNKKYSFLRHVVYKKKKLKIIRINKQLEIKKTYISLIETSSSSLYIYIFSIE